MTNLKNLCMPVSLTEKNITFHFLKLPGLKIYHLHFHHCATASHRHINFSRMQDVCHMNLVQRPSHHESPEAHW